MNTKTNKWKYNRDNPNKFDKLKEDWILGVITNQDDVLSEQHYFADAPTHEDL